MKQLTPAYPLLPELDMFKHASVEDQFILSQITEVKVFADYSLLVGPPMKKCRGVCTCKDIRESFKRFKGFHVLRIAGEEDRSIPKELEQYEEIYEARLRNGTYIKIGIHPTPDVSPQTFFKLSATTKAKLTSMDQAKSILAARMPICKILFKGNVSSNSYKEIFLTIACPLKVRRVEWAVDFFTKDPRKVKNVLLKYIKVPWAGLKEDKPVRSYFSSSRAKTSKSTFTLYRRGPDSKKERNSDGFVTWKKEDEDRVRAEYKRLGFKIAKMSVEDQLTLLQSKKAYGWHFQIGKYKLEVEERIRYW